MLNVAKNDNPYDKYKKVGVRDTLVNDYGADNGKIGWKDNGDNGGTVTYGDYNLLDIGEDNIQDGKSFIDHDILKGAIDNYEGIGLSSQGNPATREYESNNKYSENIDTLLDSILNPQEFDYNPATDPSYQSYKKQYTREGNRAMKDTMASASAMSGGRLNSWATSAGSQANNYYMEQLADKVPELEDKAYNRNKDAINDQYNQLNALNGLENQEYNRFNDERNFDYGVDSDNKAQEHQESRDAINDERYDKEWDYKVTQDAIRNYGNGPSNGPSTEEGVEFTPKQQSLYNEFLSTLLSPTNKTTKGDPMAAYKFVANKSLPLIQQELGEEGAQLLLDELQGMISIQPHEDNPRESEFGSKDYYKHAMDMVNAVDEVPTGEVDQFGQPITVQQNKYSNEDVMSYVFGLGLDDVSTAELLNALDIKKPN